jgi:zona occludens toxin
VAEIMISLFTGAPGAGKSYAAVRFIAKALEQGKPVVTNVPLKDGWALTLAKTNLFRRLVPGRVERVAAQYERQLYVSESLEDLMRVRLRGKGEGRGLMVLDEAHRHFNARTWDSDEDGRADKGVAIVRRLRFVKYFSGHRHYGFDIILITQDANNIDRQIRTLFEYLVIARNLRNFKLVGIPIIPVNLFLTLWCWTDRSKTIVKRETYFLKKRIAGLYSTHALAEVDLPDDVVWMPRLVGEDGGTAGREDGRSAAAEPRRTSDRTAVALVSPPASADGDEERPWVV